MQVLSFRNELYPVRVGFSAGRAPRPRSTTAVGRLTDKCQDTQKKKVLCSAGTQRMVKAPGSAVWNARRTSLAVSGSGATMSRPATRTELPLLRQMNNGLPPPKKQPPERDNWSTEAQQALLKRVEAIEKRAELPPPPRVSHSPGLAAATCSDPSGGVHLASSVARTKALCELILPSPELLTEAVEPLERVDSTLAPVPCATTKGDRILDPSPSASTLEAAVAETTEIARQIALSPLRLNLPESPVLRAVWERSAAVYERMKLQRKARHISFARRQQIRGLVPITETYA